MAIYIAHVITLKQFEGRPSALRSVDRGMNVTMAFPGLMRIGSWKSWSVKPLECQPRRPWRWPGSRR